MVTGFWNVTSNIEQKYPERQQYYHANLDLKIEPQKPRHYELFSRFEIFGPRNIFTIRSMSDTKSGTDPGFRARTLRGGGGGGQHMILPKCPKKLFEKIFEHLGGGRAGHRKGGPLDPLLKMSRWVIVFISLLNLCLLFHETFVRVRVRTWTFNVEVGRM